MTSLPPYLESLNPQQREAASHINGPLLILAGAGAGKTKTLTHRILHLIHNGVAPHEILAITFTNKAAGELRERINILLREEGSRPRELPLASTFHSLGVRILRENHSLAGLPRFFSIFDRGDSLRAIKRGMKELGISDNNLKPSKLLSVISSWKSKGLTPQDIEGEINSYTTSFAADVWREYERTLAREGALDFDDLLLKTKQLLLEKATVRQLYQQRWKYVHIDEYQDTNHVQYEMARLLVGPEENICAVGDADQTIYVWRGANIDNILNFEKDFPTCTTVLLEQNYRSTKTIIQAANDCIRKNTLRKEKNLYTENHDGDPIDILVSETEVNEAEGVAEKISELTREGEEDIAILYRANFQSRVLEEALLRAGVPYQLVGTRFFERKEVKDVLSYIRYALNPQSLTDLARIVATPPRGIGAKTLESYEKGGISNLPAGTRRKFEHFLGQIEKIHHACTTEVASEAVKKTIIHSGLEEMYQAQGDEGQERLENIHELVSLASKFNDYGPRAGIEKLLEEASLMSDQDTLKEGEKGVRLMTIHASKGLEFDTVFITGLEDGLFPQHKPTSTRAEEEEERRLFYVALTRARKKLYVSYALSRLVFGSRMYNPPSEFVTELDPELIVEPIFAESSIRKGGYLDDIEF